MSVERVEILQYLPSENQNEVGHIKVTYYEKKWFRDGLIRPHHVLVSLTVFVNKKKTFIPFSAILGKYCLVDCSCPRAD